MGRGGARRRTRRRMTRRTALLSAQQKEQVQQHTGKSADDLSEEELLAAMKKLGMEPTKDEGGAGVPDYTEELERLAGLRDKNIITDEEFQAKKRQLLGL